ncbi:MAG: hypothetical protein CMB22_02170 [Euryarchaeota archaeon]|nr:hypothetical protein [Euryarchaeota archaeon]|tara:strand:+ start:8345 stop:9037 length:693 start_codon:yes stop_codon:yes gene_type:complete
MRESPCGERMARILLASESERRRDWLASFLEGEEVNFHSRGLSAEEAVAPGFLDVSEKVEFTCMAKAMSASEEQSILNSEKNGENEVFDMVIVSDTLVEDPDDHLVSMGKPNSDSEAVAMLLRLSGNRHRVWSSTAILSRPGGPLFDISLHGGWTSNIWTESSIVEFEDLSEESMVELIKSESWRGKAGSYDLAGEASIHCKLVEGEEVTVLGLASESMEFLRGEISRQR